MFFFVVVKKTSKCNHRQPADELFFFFVVFAWVSKRFSRLELTDNKENNSERNANFHIAKSAEATRSDDRRFQVKCAQAQFCMTINLKRSTLNMPIF